MESDRDSSAKRGKNNEKKNPGPLEKGNFTVFGLKTILSIVVKKC